MSDRFLTPPRIAKMIGVGADQVLTWINSGELIAFNSSAGDRPRWKVSPENLQRFIASRSNGKPLPKRVSKRVIATATKSYV